MTTVKTCKNVTKLYFSAPWTHIEGVKVKLHSFLNLIIGAGEWSTSDSADLPAGKNSGTH
jgi:hypothetical protein